MDKSLYIFTVQIDKSLKTPMHQMHLQKNQLKPKWIIQWTKYSMECYSFSSDSKLHKIHPLWDKSPRLGSQPLRHIGNSNLEWTLMWLCHHQWPWHYMVNKSNDILSMLGPAFFSCFVAIYMHTRHQSTIYHSIRLHLCTRFSELGRYFGYRWSTVNDTRPSAAAM